MTVPVPERRGDWPGATRYVRDRLAPDGTRRVPVCPLCAKALLHTADEHDQLTTALGLHGAPAATGGPFHDGWPDRPARVVHVANDIL